VDYLSPLKKKLLRGKLLNISKGRVSPHYQIRVPV
jgi:peptide deformylase